MDDEDELFGRRYGNCSSKVVIGIFFAIGITLAVPAAFFMVFFELMVKQELALKPNTDVYKYWITPPVPVYMTYYVFNYTNTPEILSNHAKPHVAQLGPYVYREDRVNHVVQSNESTITYMQNISYIFDSEKSCASCLENDIVMTLSIPEMTVLNAISDQINGSNPLADLVDILINGLNQLTLFEKLTVREVLWGYDDPILTLVKEVQTLLKGIGVVLPPVIDSLVALQLNGTAGMEDVGNITILTGIDNIKDVQRITRWRGMDEVPFWLTKYGRMINGTDGTRGVPFTSRGDVMYIFSTQVCRSLYAKYLKDTTVRGVPAFKFATTPDLFANHSANPDNIAFCSPGPKCWGTGLLPLDECKKGAPIFMSAPHFYQCYPELAEQVDGMNPNEALHRTYLNIEPLTGLLLEGHKRLQLNVLVKKSFLNKTAPLQNQNNFLPVFYVDENVIIDDASAQKLEDKVFSPRFALSCTQYVLIGAGAAMILHASMLLVMWMFKKYEQSPYGEFINPPN